MKSPHACKVLPDSHIDVQCLAIVFPWKKSAFQAIQDCHVAKIRNIKKQESYIKSQRKNPL